MKNFYYFYILLCISLFGAACLFAFDGSIPRTAEVQEEIYKKIGEVELKAWIHTPPNHKTTEPKPAIVFFFGGGWRSGTPKQFEKHAEYLAVRGMIAIRVDYRVSSRHGVKVNDCVSDAKSAIRWMRKHAERLGIDPDRIIASGGSAGGHLAAATATLPGHDDPADDMSISASPNALVLFNPVLVLAEIEGGFIMSEGLKKSLASRMGAEASTLSPYHHIKSGIGPSIIFHGTVDKTVPHRTVALFEQEMQRVGNDCKLISYKDQGHGFFNYGRSQNGPFIHTVQKMDEFLVSLGYLAAPPEVVPSQP